MLEENKKFAENKKNKKKKIYIEKGLGDLSLILRFEEEEEMF